MGWVVVCVLATVAWVVAYDQAHPPTPSATELQAKCPAYKARIRQLNQREGLTDLNEYEEQERTADEEYTGRWCASP